MFVVKHILQKVSYGIVFQVLKGKLIIWEYT